MAALLNNAGEKAVVNDHGSDNIDGASPAPLNIAIVGAGIGGLTAAVGLRRNGHNVTLYEQSRFASEIGAALHLAPNANGILRRYGIYAEEFGGVNMNGIVDYDDRGVETLRIDLTESNKLWQHPRHLVHRVKLHDRLKQTATSERGSGPPAILHTSNKVLEVDPDAGTLILENGQQVKADVVIGADGIYSKTRTFVSGHSSKPFGSGKAAFRFLIHRKTALADSIASKLCQKENELVTWHGADRKVVMYPCDDNELLNFVCIHPEGESQGGADGWNKSASLEQMLKVYKDFDPTLSALLRLADPGTLKVWKLLDMEVLPKWTKGQLALLGDAAHPFLPYQGQGGGVAIEDAACLAVILPYGTLPEDVPQRLKLYEKIRQERANTIQEYSRQAGKDFVNGRPPIDMMKYTVYNFSHDEWDNSTLAFKKWQYAKNPNLYWRMPVGFGPAPGPRQDIWGRRRDAINSTFATASIKFKTSRTFLQNLFPTDSFTFKSPGTVAYASFIVTTLNKMAWLGGGGYNHFGLYIHGVQYKKKDGSTIDGTHLAVLFENLADPILTGREELGMPKVFCEIDLHRREKSYRMQASWRGAKFCDFNLEGLSQPAVSNEQGLPGGDPEYGMLVYRYIPAVGERGKADVEYPVVVPHGEEISSKVHTILQAQKSSVTFDRMNWDALPTLYHVVDVLADILFMKLLKLRSLKGRAWEMFLPPED